MPVELINMLKTYKELFEENKDSMYGIEWYNIQSTYSFRNDYVFKALISVDTSVFPCVPETGIPFIETLGYLVVYASAITRTANWMYGKELYYIVVHGSKGIQRSISRSLYDVELLHILNALNELPAQTNLALIMATIQEHERVIK